MKTVHWVDFFILQVVVVEHGQVVESGTHNDLIKLGNVYHKLTHRQTLPHRDSFTTIQDVPLERSATSA